LRGSSLSGMTRWRSAWTTRCGESTSMRLPALAVRSAITPSGCTEKRSHFCPVSPLSLLR
jgi:hypothetical protein